MALKAGYKGIKKIGTGLKLTTEGTLSFDGSGPGGSVNLDDLGDVAITDPAEGQILQYDATSQKWVNHINVPEYITISVDIYSAASDTVTYTDVTGQKTVTTDTDGHGRASITCVNGDSITFTSSVAKNPSDLSQAYSKTVTIGANTTEVYIIPDGAVYWYGCYKKPMSVYASATSGSSGSRVSPTLTNSTNYFTCSMSPSSYCTGSMFTSNAVSLTGYNTIQYVVRTASATASGGYGGFVAAMLANSTSDNYTALATSNIVNNETKSNTVFSQSLSGVSANTGYVGFRLGTASAASISISAIVLE